MATRTVLGAKGKEDPLTPALSRRERGQKAYPGIAPSTSTTSDAALANLSCSTGAYSALR